MAKTIDMDRLHTVYALDDPRDDRVRYIGVEAFSLRGSFNGDKDVGARECLARRVHILSTAIYHNYLRNPKEAWLVGLQFLRLKPKIAFLSLIEPPNDPIKEKRFWIGVHLEHGHPLLNTRNRPPDQPRTFSEDETAALARGEILELGLNT